MSTDQTPTIAIPEIITVGDFAGKLGVPVTKIIGDLMKNGVMASINEHIDFDTAAIIGSDLGFTIEAEVNEKASSKPAAKLAEGEGDARPPIVAVMGHVDHGKTSLLDAIRSADVAAGEAGGITQHIGAYQIKRGERWITFLDTPGHEAFSALRAHGARMTDVAIIVVAADDGVRPQTKEAIKHAQEAGVQIVIALNKIDKEGADPLRVRSELSELGITAEDWGGKTVMVEVSAKSGEGVEKLLDLVLLVADLEDLRAKYEGLADGVVVESHIETGRGPVATLLIRNGELNVGDVVVSGSTYAKIRSLEDWRGRKIKKASPGMPVVVLGLKAVPDFGDLFHEVEDERTAREQTLASRRHDSIKSMVKVKKIGVAELSDAITAGKIKELNVVVKADVAGSLESLTESLNGIQNDEVAVRIVSSGIGDVSESDVTLAASSGALILGFNVGMNSTVKQLSNRESVKIQLYKVIYELLDDIRDIMSELLPPEIIETETGRLKVLGVFKITKTAVICGGEVMSGKVEPKRQLHIVRKDEIIGEGTVSSLQKEKQAAREVIEGEQCGMDVVTQTKIEVGDELVYFTTESRARRV